MVFKAREHPLMFYLTFVMPAVLFALGAVFRANVFLLILCGMWLGISFLILYLPLEAEGEQS
jgi:hypothetical protein